MNTELKYFTGKLKPVVRRCSLLLISGLMWSAVGIMLNAFAYRWLHTMPIMQIIPAVTGGIILGLTITFFGFSKIVQKNINRILALPVRVCVFAFQEWKSYILIVVMMSMGIYLRSHSFMPKVILGGGYIGIGTALFLSGLPYYREFIKQIQFYKNN